MGKIVSFFIFIYMFRIDCAKKLQVLFLRSNNLTNNDLEHISNSLKTNATIKVIDISSNQDLTGDAVIKLGDILDTNRNIEYFGLAKLNLENKHVTPFFNLLGKFAFPADKV